MDAKEIRFKKKLSNADFELHKIIFAVYPVGEVDTSFEHDFAFSRRRDQRHGKPVSNEDNASDPGLGFPLCIQKQESAGKENDGNSW